MWLANSNLWGKIVTESNEETDNETMKNTACIQRKSRPTICLKSNLDDHTACQFNSNFGSAEKGSLQVGAIIHGLFWESLVTENSRCIKTTSIGR
jgi:hypothetical protein